MSSKSKFKFVLIPFDKSEPIEILKGDKSGGLNDDYLLKYAKNYFQEQAKKSNVAGGSSGALTGV